MVCWKIQLSSLGTCHAAICHSLPTQLYLMASQDTSAGVVTHEKRLAGVVTHEKRLAGVVTHEKRL